MEIRLFALTCDVQPALEPTPRGSMRHRCRMWPPCGCAHEPRCARMSRVHESCTVHEPCTRERCSGRRGDSRRHVTGAVRRGRHRLAHAPPGSQAAHSGQSSSPAQGSTRTTGRTTSGRRTAGAEASAAEAGSRGGQQGQAAGAAGAACGRVGCDVGGTRGCDVRSEVRVRVRSAG
jgi:hypothetical protein